jgi:hypothetical protein
MPFFRVQNGFIVSPELDDYRVHLEAIRAKQSEGGKQSAANKKGKNKSAETETGQGMQGKQVTSKLPASQAQVLSSVQSRPAQPSQKQSLLGQTITNVPAMASERNNTMQRFHDLSFSSQPDGSIRLMQSDCGEDYILDMHPEQLLFIARQLCGMKPETADKVADLERRIAVLTDRLQDFACNTFMRGEIIDRLGHGFEYLAKLDALLDLALEFDGGRLTPGDPPDEKPVPEQKPTSKFRPGPPPKNGLQLGLAV